MSSPIAAQIFWSFFKISLVSFGGVFGVLKDLEADWVIRHAWVTHDQFMRAYVSAQFVPGPNMVMCPLLGYQIGGWSGLLAGFAGIYFAPAVLMHLAFRLFNRYREVATVRRAELALRPLVIGMLSASAGRLWWQQSRQLMPTPAASVMLSVVLTLFGLLALRGPRASAPAVLLGLGLTACGIGRMG